MKIFYRIAIILILQTLVLFFMIGMKQHTLNTGIPILLETQPVDPRSLFRGDYVRLNYTISEINLDQLAGDKDFQRRDPVFVLLKKSNKYWEPASVHKAYPETQPDTVIIKGEVEYLQSRLWNDETKVSEKANLLRIRYGIENYFVPEGKGMELERPQDGEIVEMVVAVDKSGNAGIKAVLVNGDVKYEETLL
ncbi:MAG: GDYXXLXY domain-containing protein [Desulfobacterales bacterium]|nr:GDYXXLXY domain-containing protein [Desulfobacterales bacterium]